MNRQERSGRTIRAFCRERGDGETLVLVPTARVAIACTRNGILEAFVHGGEWYALIVKMNSEKKVTRALSAKGFGTFVPVICKTRQWTDRAVTTDWPLFPCVVFCRFDLTQRLSVLNTPGVLHIAGGGEKPPPVESAVMHDLQTLYRNYEFRISQFLISGTAVSIPVQNEVVTGIPLKSESRNEIAINIEPLGCAVLFTLPPT